MKKTDHFIITTARIKTGVKKSLTGSLELSGYAKDMLERNANTSLALGLYTFAIEEYGKSLLLKESIQKNEDRHKVKKIIFYGKCAHDEKFGKAFSTLPKECISFSSEIKQSSPQFNSEIEHEGIEIPDGVTGTFYANILSDMQVRMSCFYLDWNDKTEKWKLPPKINEKLLLESISIFEKYVSAKLDLEYGN